MTQEALAERAGISVETIRKLEQNERTTARMATLNAIARALHTTTSALIGNASTAAVRKEADHDQVALLDLRSILTPARGLSGHVERRTVNRPLSLDTLRADIRSADQAYHGDDYAMTLAALPVLLDNAQTSLDAATETRRAEAWSLLSASYQLAGTALVQLRSFDLAYQALSRAIDAADAAEDEIGGASSVVTLCWLLLRQGRLGEAERLAVHTADQIEPRFSQLDAPRLATWGWLLLRAAAAAARDSRPDDAETFLDAAAAAAARIGERMPTEALSPGPVSIGAFCSTTVAMKRVEAVTLVGDATRALALAERVPPGGRVTSNNHNRYRLDVAHANAIQGAYADSTAILMETRRNAPTWLRHQRYARDIVALIATARRRAMSKELADLADLVGVEV